MPESAKEGATGLPEGSDIGLGVRAHITVGCVHLKARRIFLKKELIRTRF